MGDYPDSLAIAQKLLEQQAEINRLRGELTAARTPEPSAYISGDGYLYLRCDGCGEIITCIDAGSSLAGLNAEAGSHTCATREVTSDG